MLIPYELRSPKTWTSHIENHHYGFFITLNTDRYFSTGLSASAYGDVTALERPMWHITSDLRRYCLGRYCRELQDSIRFVAAYEIGPVSGLLHVHLLMAHTGTVTRSAEEIKKYLQKAAQKEQFGHWTFTDDIDVQPFGDAWSRVGYMLKDSAAFARIVGEQKMTLF